jgi:hypothetical protein
MFFLLNISLLLMVYFVCATPRSFKECYLIDCGDLCNCAKKNLYFYMQLECSIRESAWIIK